VWTAPVLHSYPPVAEKWESSSPSDRCHHLPGGSDPRSFSAKAAGSL
jgi:hypothetical protein